MESSGGNLCDECRHDFSFFSKWRKLSQWNQTPGEEGYWQMHLWGMETPGKAWVFLENASIFLLSLEKRTHTSWWTSTNQPTSMLTCLEEGMQPTPVFLPGESHGQRSLAGYSPWGRRESDMTEQLNTSPYLESFAASFHHSVLHCSDEQWWAGNTGACSWGVSSLAKGNPAGRTEGFAHWLKFEKQHQDTSRPKNAAFLSPNFVTTDHFLEI